MKKKILILSSIVLIIGSCTDETIQGNGNKVNSASIDNTLPSKNPEIVYSMQSSPKLMVFDRIICENSIFVLDLSFKEASELMIPREIYEEALREVERMNEPSEKR